MLLPFSFLTQEFLIHFKQTTIKLATLGIEALLKKSVQKEMPNKPIPNWRTHEENFIPKSSRDGIEPGAVTFSSGWFGQGHEVRFHFNNKSRINLTPKKPD
jgi:hypothetical protein